MTKLAAIQGTFSDFRTVKGRKVAQLIIEVPIELATAAITTLGGVPNPTDPKWVAIAMLAKEPAQADEDPRRTWEDLPAAQQAAIRCGELDFRRYLHRHHRLPVSSQDEAAQQVREWCGVESRRELNTNSIARDIWRRLDADYRDAMTLRAA